MKDWDALRKDVVAAESLEAFKQGLHPRGQLSQWPALMHILYILSDLIHHGVTAINGHPPMQRYILIVRCYQTFPDPDLDPDGET